MNKLQEVGAGLLLLFGSDGPAAQRAGDALLEDRIAEAVEEGGFASVAYDAWRKVPGDMSRLEFDGIRLIRGNGTVEVASAEMEVFSQALGFEGGRFEWESESVAWNFDAVNIVPGGLFSGALSISARGLVPEPAKPMSDCPDTYSAGCALLRIGTGAIDRFEMLFEKRGRAAVVTLGWRSDGMCHVVWSADGRGSADLATWGRVYLGAPSAMLFSIANADCSVFEGDEIDLGALRIAATSVTEVDGSVLMEATPVLATTLFGLVAESYAYLLE